MTERLPSAIGTVAEEAARLIEDMAAMARMGPSPRRGPSRDPHMYAGGPAHDPDTPGAQHSQPHDPPGASPDEPPLGENAAPEDAPADAASGVCTVCGGGRDGTPVACRLCPICQGITLMRSVRPETVDLLADLALAVAGTLRDVATRSRASDQGSSAGFTSGGSSGKRRAEGGRTDGGRAEDGRAEDGRTERGHTERGHAEGGHTGVQDIPVDDDSES